MNENLPAVRTEPAAGVVVARDTDSWAEQLPAIVDLSRSICGTDFVPDSIRNNIPATAAAMLYGREVGLPPLTALSNVNVIKGRVGLSAVIMRAQVLAAGHEIRQDESNHALCKMSGRRRGTDYWQTVTYTIDDAKQAGHTRNDQYQKNPRRMLRARATSELCELMFADVVRGMPSLEELEDLDEDTPAGPATATGKAKVQRASKARTPKNDDGAVLDPPGPDSTPAPSSPPMPPLPGEPGYDDGTVNSVAGPAGAESRPATDQDAEAAPAASASAQTGDGTGRGQDPPFDEGAATGPVSPSLVDEPRMITRAQQRGIFALFGDLGIRDDAERLHITSALVGRTPMHQGKPSSNGLTADEATALTSALATCKTRDHVEALIEMAVQDRVEAGES